MKSISTSLVLVLCFLTTMIEGLTRYQTTPPSDAIVCHDRQALNDLAKAYPDGLLHPENGGYYLKDGDEVVVGIASDDLCKELDGAFASVDAKIAEEAESAGPEDNISDAENVKRDSLYKASVGGKSSVIKRSLGERDTQVDEQSSGQDSIWKDVYRTVNNWVDE
ncbi:uncharacterized protein PGRI_040350 [Penicillium griseofulvum]|uniref:Uncharacterized protein n=1 Tax=Penicillium patulum TaxID=5078 RepID=A0A135L943_PENPA|nr:uncharacterized protein PGRI_040350 [Penicillium griseofulvum]KXG45486.1 hypothetical protein PGRI_040350 [Penicillium griseofulvum]